MAKQTFTTGQVLTAAQMNSLQSNDFNQTVSVKTAAYTLVAADKGTRIEFNTSGSVTCTVNTGVFDAGDTLVIQNRGAGVVTVTAGTATVNTSATLALSQYDAGTLYFVSASAAIFFNTDAGGGSPLTTKGDLFGFSTVDARIPIGANNTVLTADSGETLGLKWAAPAAAAFVGCSVYDTGTQNVANNTNTAVTWNSEDFDTDAFHSTTSNTSRFTIPSGKDGKYLFQGAFRWDNNVTGDRTIAVWKNGVNIINYYPLVGSFPSAFISHIFNLVATDYLEIYAVQNSGGTRTIDKGSPGQGWASITYLGA